MAATSDMTVAGERGAMKEGRKDFLTVRNVLVLFSVVSGAMSFLSAFAPALPISWSDTLQNVLVGYHLILRDPIVNVVKGFGFSLLPIQGDLLVFYWVFVVPALVQYAFGTTTTGTAVSLNRKTQTVIMMLYGIGVPLFPSFTQSGMNQVSWSYAAISLLIMLLIMLSPLPRGVWYVNRAQDEEDRLERKKQFWKRTLEIYGRSAAVFMLVMLTLFVNRVLIGYGY